MLMFFEREEAIRSRAHAMWLREGRPDGRALDHWLVAQHEHSAVDLAMSWYDAVTAGDPAEWMRRMLWTPQPFSGHA